MNKLFTKIAALALGATMATGVGVAAATSSSKANPAAAASAWQAHTGAITAGNEYLIVKVSGDKCMKPTNTSSSGSTTTNAGNYSQTSFTASSGPDMGFIFGDAGNGKFYIRDGTTYVRANGTTNNGLCSAANNTTNPNYGIWTVTETSTSGQYTIINANSRQLSAYSTSNWRSYATTSTGSITNVKLYEKAKTAQTITASATEAYSDESVTLTTNATSATWSITSGGSYAHLSSTSGKSVSLVGDAAGSVTVKAVASGYTDATKTITFTERPSGTYYDVTFNSNGGSISPAKESIKENETFTFPSPGTKTHYSFLGWSSNGGTTKYATGATSPAVVADITYTAYWQEDAKYTVTYVKGAHGTGSNYVVNNQYAGSYTLVTFATAGFTADEGYKFSKWSVGGVEYAEGASITLSANTTVTAIYSEVVAYTLVTDPSTLRDGTEFVLVDYVSSTYRIARDLNSGHIKMNTVTSATTVSGTTAGSTVETTEADVFTLVGSSGAWEIKRGNTYLQFTGTSNGNDSFTSTSGADTKFSIVTSSTSNKLTINSNSRSNRALRYNTSTGDLRNYANDGSQTDLYMFAIIPASSCSVTYNANGATSGTVPTDATSYTTGDTVTVIGNTGSLAKTGFAWNGWNTKADGSGEHYVANDTFEISGDTTLYAEWTKTLDAISSIGGSVTATVSQAGSYNWDYSNLTVTGTISGVTGQDVKSYVDLSSATAIPSSIGSCTVSVTATKKSSVPGSATSLTNNNVSGEVVAPKLVYTFTMSYEDLTTGASYATEDNNIKTSTATCDGHNSIEISWRTSNVQKNNSSGVYSMQFRGSPVGYLYNMTEIPGTITGISYNDTVLQGSFTNYYGNSEHPTESTTVGGKYFSVVSSTGTDKVQSITVTFEVSDKPSVQLVAENITLDVADGAATPTITDGSSAVAGYSLVSEDAYIASITNDGKVQPVGYGKVIVTVTKPEDSGHIYLPTTFVVTVGDHSKQKSIMEFVEKSDGSATADDGVEWTISANASENAFSEVYGINFGTNANKVSSLTLTTPADSDRIIKNVVVEAMSAIEGSTITVSVGGTQFDCSKSTSLNGAVTTFNFSGNTSGAIAITISGTQSSKYGVKSIAVLYVGDEAESFASTFLTAVVCDSSGTTKPSFSIKEGETYWTWALLATEFNKLSAEDKAKFAVGATGVSSTITDCVNRYDYIVGKYYKTGVDLSFTDFMNRNPSPVGQSRLIAETLISESTGTVAIIVIVSLVSITAVGGYFFLRRRKEN